MKGIKCRLFHRKYWFIGGKNFETHCGKCGHRFNHHVK